MSSRLPLSNGGFTAVDADVAQLYGHKAWSKTDHGYAVSSDKIGPGKYRTIYLHRIILNADKGQQVDHINGDRLDNRRENLRLCSAKENRRNMKPIGGTSQYVGVYLNKRKGNWHAGITVDNKHLHLGTFPTELEAAIARDEAARRLHGPFAKLNFPEEK